jgi:hypothetical protein
MSDDAVSVPGADRAADAEATGRTVRPQHASADVAPELFG